jgi:hypothetical protein
MKRYHLYKQTRVYCGYPYQGATSDDQPAEYETFEEAVHMSYVFNERNPVGWNVFDSVTKELVHGIDFFGD